MTRALLLLAAAALATPALAQSDPHASHRMPADGQADPHAGHEMPGEPQADPHTEHQMPDEQQADPHAGHQLPDEQQADPHAGHQMPEGPQPAPADPHAGHRMPTEPQPEPADPHAGHQMQGHHADPHAGHDMTGTAAPDIPPGPPPPEALTGPRHAADAFWGADEMKRGRDIMREEHGGLPVHRILVDRAEARIGQGGDFYLLEAEAWYGGDIDKLWLKSELEGGLGKKPEHVEVQALWSHALDPWFDVRAGVRFDPQPGPDRSHLVLGIQGLAPYWWEVEGTLFLSDKGDVTARVEAEYDLRVTQKLILQPRVEVDLSLQDVPELSIGAGLSNASLGIRLRYQISPLVAPYIGVEYERAFGRTRRFLRAEGEDPGGFYLVAGVRFSL